MNRRLVKIHDLKEKFTFKVQNPYAEDGRDLFFSDPPHLIKTTRNCWASKSRSLWVSCTCTSIILIIMCFNTDNLEYRMDRIYLGPT